MKITIYGTGCKKCKQLFANAEEAVRTTGASAEVVKVEDMDKIVAAGVMLTPGLAIDGEIKSTGKLPAPAQIARWIKEAQ